MKRGLVFGLRVSLLFLGTGCALAAGLANPRDYQGKRILEIRFEPPQQPLTSAQIAQFLPVKLNTPLQMRDVDAAIRSLFSTGRYSDIEVAGETAGNGVALIIRTKDQYFVGGVRARGKIKNPPNIGQLENATQLNLGEPFDDQGLQTAVQGLEDLLRQEGFYSAKVVPHLTPDPAHQQMNLLFEVDPGKRAHFSKAVITGQPGMPDEEVAEAAKWKRFFWWKPLTSANVQNGLQNVRKKYESKNRLMASIRLESLKYNPDTNTVTPTLNVVGGPKVDVKTVGAKVSQKKLKDYVPIWDEEMVYRGLLIEGVRNLTDYFQSQGYFDAEVDYQQSQVAPDHEQIVYTVTLGKRQKLVEVEVHGSRYFSASNIRDRMFIQPAGFIRLRHGRYSRGFATRDESAITALYQSNGFRDVKVTIDTIPDYHGKTGDVAAVVNVQEGPQYLVSDLTVTGAEHLNLQTIQPMLSTSKGQPFSEYNIALDRNYILRQYRESGYPNAVFTYSQTPGPRPHTFNVAYSITEGPKRIVREVLIGGDPNTSRRLIDPTIRLKPGDPLSLEAMTATQRNMYDLGIFAKVDTAVQDPDGATQNKYVLYQLEQGHRYEVNAGFGAEIARIGGGQSSLQAPGGTTGFSPRGDFEITRNNMFGLGHSLNFQSLVSTLERRALITYSMPRYRNVEGRNITISELYDLTQNVRTFTGRRWESTAQLSQRLGKGDTMLFRYSFRRVSVDQNTLKIQPELIPLLSQPVRIGMPSTSYIRDHRDDPADAHKGMFTTLDFGVSHTAFGSKPDFSRFLGRNALYHTFGSSGVVLAEQLEFGWIAPFAFSGVTRDQAVPLPERFFGGGSLTNRGFPDNQAGPRDPVTGFPIGGNALLFHNTELRFPLIGDNIGGVLFHDMGNVYSTLGDMSFHVHQRNLADFNYMVHAVGFGIRYKTPVGPIRLDLAYSINPPTFFGFKGDIQQLLFGTGQKTVQNISHFQFFFSIGQTF